MKPPAFFALLWAATVVPFGCGKDRGSSGPTATQPPASTTSTIAASTKEDLRGVWGSGPADVWAVGNHGTILHFDGRVSTLSKSGTVENLTSIHGTGPNDVWAGGQEGTILHWDGAAWTQASRQEGTAV